MNLFGVQSHLYKKRLVATPLFVFLVFQVERETVMTDGTATAMWIHGLPSKQL